MQENNFERQVQQKMDGLTLSPSTAVWQKMQLELEKKRNKKKGWVIIILLLICITGGGLIFIPKHSKTTISKNEVIKYNAAVNDASATTNELPEKLSSNKKLNTQSKNESLSQQNKLNIKQVTSNITDKANVNTTNKNIGVNEKQISNTANKGAINKQQKFSRKTAAKTTMQVTNAEVETVSIEVLPMRLSKQLALFSLQIMENHKDIAHSTIINNSFRKKLPFLNENTVIKNVIKKEKLKRNIVEKHKNVSLIISFGTGQSATASKFLGATANRSYYDNAGSFGNNGTPGSVNSASNIPSSIKPATGLFFGIAAAKQISPKSSLSIGLQYQFSSTSISVGQPIIIENSRIRFAGGNNNNYTNRYHFIQIPIEFSTQLSHFKRHNLFLNTGVSLSQLLHTNALQFNNTAGRYFMGNDYFNKTIIGLSAGISINLLKDNEAPLLLGPAFSYSLTAMADKGLYDRSHYGFFGIRLQKVIKKK